MTLVAYFKKYPNQFPLWHLKDMDKAKKEHTGFGKGSVNRKQMPQNINKEGVNYFSLKPGQYPGTALERARYDVNHLAKLDC